MNTGDDRFTVVNGLMWPKQDQDCRAVVFNTTPDLDRAISYVPVKEVAIQAGGNCGVWALHLAKVFEQVITFEPEPLNFACLDHNCKDVTNIICVEAAIGDYSPTGGIEMYYPEGERNMGACAVKSWGSIPLFRLDDIPDLRRVDFMQLDLEGYELEALKGARRLIEKFHPVLMIEDKGLSDKYGAPEGWSERYLERYGYKRVERIHRDNIFVRVR